MIENKTKKLNSLVGNLIFQLKITFILFVALI